MSQNTNVSQHKLWPPKRYRDCPVKAVTFVEKKVRGETRVVGYLNIGDGMSAILYPIDQFRPTAGKTYNVYYRHERDNDKGPICTVCPAIADPYLMLGMDEWLQPEALHQSLTASLTFRLEPPKHGKGAPRPFCLHKGKAVFQDRGSEVVLDKPALYLLREEGTAYHANLIKIEQSFGSALILIGVEKGALDPLALRYVVLKSATAKAGVARPMRESECDIKIERRSIYDLLSSPRGKAPFLVDERSSAGEIKKAYRLKVGLVHTDVAEADFLDAAGKPRMPFETWLESKFYAAAFKEAYDQALKIIELREKLERKDADEATDRSRDERGPEQAAVRAAIIGSCAVVPAEIPASAEVLPASEQKPDVAASFMSQGETDEVGLQLAGLAKDHKTSVEVIRMAIQLAGVSTPLEFVALATSVQRFRVREAKGKLMEPKSLRA